MTWAEKEKAYHHALQFWWRRAIEAEKTVNELVDKAADLEEENQVLRARLVLGDL